MSEASKLIRDSIAAPSSLCANAGTIAHGDPEKCLACRVARSARWHWDRDHPIRPDLDAPEIRAAVADLLDAVNADLTGFEEQLTLFRAARALEAAITRTGSAS